MNKIKGVIKTTTHDRPFDFYVAALLFFAGLYGIIDDSWPESIGVDLASTIIVIISLYLMFSGLVIMLALGCNRKKYPVISLIAEMYGWLFVSSASLAIIITEIAAMTVFEPRSWWTWAIIVGVWGGLLVSSLLRFIDLFIIHRGLYKNG